MFWSCAMWLTGIRSRMFMPFFIARIGSPLKYAVRCSNSVKSSTDRRLRFEPWICWWKTPRRLVVSSGKRRCCGRPSGVRWNCPVVWPFTWQSSNGRSVASALTF